MLCYTILILFKMTLEGKEEEFEEKISDINIDYYKQLIRPHKLIEQLSPTPEVINFVQDTRTQIRNILSGQDYRKLFIVGPCSIHNIEEAKLYGFYLKDIAEQVCDKILIVMRVYFEKPRTTIGWKGLINDPYLNNSFNVNKGLLLARELLLYLNSIGIGCAYEILDTITPQYISDLVSWGAIGARTTESQVHRQIVSGLSMPVGFKNGTDGNIEIALNAIKSAKSPHCFMGITPHGIPAICKTLGNKYCHVILRGSNKGPNYYEEDVNDVIQQINNSEINTKIMIDCSHGNSQKKHSNQPIVLQDVIRQIIMGNSDIMGVMIESNIHEGKQPLTEDLKYGISITDSCISIDTTKSIILEAFNKL
jgi:3-deoxy-7-phosphoheptulonate synthase